MRNMTRGVTPLGRHRVLGGAVAIASATALGLAGRVALASEASDAAGSPAPAAERATMAPAGAQTTQAAPASPRAIRDIQGTFAWDQGVQTSNEALVRSLYGASHVLCGAQTDEAGAGGLACEKGAEDEADVIRQIIVSGDVANPDAYDVAQFEEQAPVSTTLGCTCTGNPADGLASANAAVAGFELRALIEAAQPTEDANTITFVCADGYEVAMPLFYVLQHRGIVVTTLNGEPATQAVGCANQLWLGGTSARSFARDIVEIRITAQAEVPAAPGVSDEANQPNVGVVAGA